MKDDLCCVIYDYKLEDGDVITQANIVDKKDLESFLCNLKDKGYTNIEYNDDVYTMITTVYIKTSCSLNMCG